MYSGDVAQLPWLIVEEQQGLVWCLLRIATGIEEEAFKRARHGRYKTDKR